MAWLLKTRDTKKHGTQYKIWTTISDGWVIKEWHSRDEIVKFLFWYKFRKFVEGFIEDSITFPNGYSNEEYERLPIDDDKRDEWYDFIMSTYKKGGDEKLFNKFYETLDKMGIKLDVSDEKYRVGNVNLKPQF